MPTENPTVPCVVTIPVAEWDSWRLELDRQVDHPPACNDAMRERALEIGIASYAAILLEDLGLPASISVRVLTGEAGSFLRLQIGDAEALVPPTRSSLPPAIFARLQQALYSSRELLVTEAVAQRVAPDIPLAELLPVLRACVRCNASVKNFAREALPHLAGTGGITRCVAALHREEKLDTIVQMSLDRYLAAIVPQRQAAAERGEALRDRHTARTAVSHPSPQFAYSDDLADDEIRLVLNGVRLPVSQVSAPLADLDAALDLVEAAWNREPALFLCFEGTRWRIEALDDLAPALAKVCEERFGCEHIHELFTSLVEENVSIRDLPRLLEPLTVLGGPYTARSERNIIFLPNAEMPVWQPAGSPSVSLTETHVNCIRVGLRRDITHRWAKHSFRRSESIPMLLESRQEMAIFLVSGGIEQLLAQSTTEEVAREAPRIIASIARDLPDAPAVLLTTQDIRKRLWRLVHGVFPQVTVIAYNELDPAIELAPVARLGEG
jgi:hypothetical protein